MTEAMIDIETLGTEPGCIIFSVGAVTFDADGVTDELLLSINLSSAQAAGLEVDANTVEWWLQQSPEAQAQLQGGDSLDSALNGLKGFVSGADTFWACSPAFDMVLLNAAFDAVDLETPWRFYQCRDYRSFRETLTTWPEREQESVDHNALDDARYQAECLIEAVDASDEVNL
jgi:Exonuclease.